MILLRRRLFMRIVCLKTCWQSLRKIRLAEEPTIKSDDHYVVLLSFFSFLTSSLFTVVLCYREVQLPLHFIFFLALSECLNSGY